MQPKIVDSETGRELWTAVECAEFSGTARGTFTSYAGRGRAPKPVATWPHPLGFQDHPRVGGRSQEGHLRAAG